MEPVSSLAYCRQLGRLARRRAPTILLIMCAAVTAIALNAPTARAATPSYCSDVFNGPVNISDRCFVRHSDDNRIYIAELKASEGGCSQTQRTYFQLRVRIVGDYERTGDKFHVRAFSIRYLSGTKPWAYFQINVRDGNGQLVNRPWNYGGNWVRYDGAGQYTDNTTNLYPPVSYSPVFGRDQVISFQVYTAMSDGPSFPINIPCVGEAVAAVMLPSALP